jgi:undecaprenyl-diphosphatase
MTTLDAIVGGAVQGLTEFLPVSSSGHLVLTRYFYGVKEGMTLTYSIFLHGGTLLAVCIALWRDIWTIARDFITGKGYGRRIGFAVIIATIPGALVGYFLESRIDAVFIEHGAVFRGIPLEPYKFVGVAFILTAVLFLQRADEVLVRRSQKKEDGVGPEKFSLQTALKIGLAQATAVVPGISRSGATIATGIMTGVSRDFAVRFSFLLSIPIILGSIAHSLPAFRVQMTYESDVQILWLGFAVAAVSGYLAIRFMLRFLATRTFHPFVVYLWIIGLLCIAS